jgi:hypothetical protein
MRVCDLDADRGGAADSLRAMRLRLGAGLASAILACGSFESGDVPTDGTSDGGPGTSSGASSGGGADGGANQGRNGGSEGSDSGDAARPPSGCALISPPFILCSDFDSSTNVEQSILPEGTTWQIQKSGSGQIDLAVGDAFSPDHALAVAGIGSAQFAAQVRVPALVIAKDIIHLKMKLRVRALPTSNDVYIAGLNFSNITFGLVLHANGKLGVAQTPKSGTLQKFTPTNASTITLNDWTPVELFVNRDTDASAVAARVGGIGSTTVLATVPIGKAELTIGLGYCDVDCGKPDLEYDDVVLTED